MYTLKICFYAFLHKLTHLLFCHLKIIIAIKCRKNTIEISEKKSDDKQLASQRMSMA